MKLFMRLTKPVCIPAQAHSKDAVETVYTCISVTKTSDMLL